MFRRALIATVFTFGSLGGLIGVASAATLHFEASLSGKAEVPAIASPATGQFLGTLDTVSKTLTYTLTFQGLTGPAAAAHFHGPAAAGANGGVAVAIGKDLNSPVTAKATLTDAQMAELEAGKWYVNVHTEANKGGEIRGQVMRTSEGAAAKPAMAKPPMAKPATTPAAAPAAPAAAPMAPMAPMKK